jgi:hypothetical protein
MKKIGIICLALVLALGTLGVGYAHWSQTLYIDTTVNTGTLCVGFQELILTEDPEAIDPTTGLPKDVGSITGEMVDQKGTHYDEYTGEYLPIYEKITVAIDNAYPCYGVHIVFTVANGGTIPADVTEVNLSDPSGELNFEWTTPPPTTPAYGYFWKDFDGDGVYDPPGPDPAVDPGEKIISVKFVNLVGHQLDPCDEEKAELDLHIEQAAEQGHTYNFLATITAVQWNLQ